LLRNRTMLSNIFNFGKNENIGEHSSISQQTCLRAGKQFREKAKYCQKFS